MFGGMPFGSIALKIFGKIIEPYLLYFDALRVTLRRAGIKSSIEEYLCSILFYCFLGFVITIIAGSFFIAYTVTMASASVTMADVFYSYTLSVIVSILAGIGIFLFGYYYPSTRSKALKNKIERSLPFTVFYMATSASSGINPVEIFKLLSQKPGPVGKEAAKIYSDVNTLGMDLSHALQKAAMRTPSPMFADLLWSMSTIITTGGDVQKYLTGKTRTFMAQYRRNLDGYAKQISLYTEIYTTLVIVGSLFFIVIISIMSPMVGGGAMLLLLQTFLVFFFVPAVSAGFIVLLKGIYPSE